VAAPHFAVSRCFAGKFTASAGSRVAEILDRHWLAERKTAKYPLFLRCFPLFFHA
jgi:hypothetical protein